MSKLPAPVAHYNSAPIPRPAPHAYATQETKAVLRGGIAEVLDGAPRRAFAQRGLRRPPELEFERPSRDAYGFAGAGAAAAGEARPRPAGPSSAFLAQLIGQSVLDPDGPRAPAGSGEAELAHGAYRQAGGESGPQVDGGHRVNLAV